MASRPPSISDSLYSSVLINPTQAPGPSQAIPKPPVTPRLKYPYPLPLLALVDLGYTIHHRFSSPRHSSNHLLALCVIRVIVLVVVLGGSRRWRSRGGWVGAGSVISLGSVVWEACKGQLVRGQGGDRVKMDMTLLIITGLMAIFEYLTFLALLRLSPPSYRLQPFGLHVPNSAIRTPTHFSYSESPASLLARHHSRSRSRVYSQSTRPRPGHGRYDSITSRLRFQEEDPSPDPDLNHDHESAQDNEDENQEMGFDDSASISESSVSESSIIDLPAPLEPNRLLPPSVSLGTGLSLAALDLDSSPVIGPLVRRTRSARFDTIRNLGRSASSAGGAGAGAEAGEREASTGYGTFGMA